MRTSLCALVVGLALAAASAEAAPPRKASTSAQMNQLLGRVCSLEYGNGTYAFRSYNPATYKRSAMRKQIRQDMRGFECRGVSFKTVTGADKVKSQLGKALALGDENAAALTKAIDGFKKLGVLQDVVYRGITGGKAYGDTYFSIPHQVFFCLKTPTGRGKRLETFFELGD